MEDNLNNSAKSAGSSETIEDKDANKHAPPSITDDPHAVAQERSPEHRVAAASKEPQSRLTLAISNALTANENLALLPDVKVMLSEIVRNQGAAATAPKILSAEKALEIRESFCQAVLDAYRDEYKELSDVWKALEVKAQGTIAIGGIFIAASFTFAKDLATTRLDYYGNLLLGAAIFLLIPSVAFSVLALKTREVSAPPTGDIIDPMVEDLMEVSDVDLPDRLLRFLYDQGPLWKTTITATKIAVEDKEQWLNLAQGLLLFAIVIAGALTLKLLNIWS